MRDQILIEEHVTFYIKTRETLALANSQVFFLPLSLSLQKKWANEGKRAQMLGRAEGEKKRNSV
jgi:hypothetical protein